MLDSDNQAKEDQETNGQRQPGVAKVVLTAAKKKKKKSTVKAAVGENSHIL